MFQTPPPSSKVPIHEGPDRAFTSVKWLGFIVAMLFRRADDLAAHLLLLLAIDESYCFTPGSICLDVTNWNKNTLSGKKLTVAAFGEYPHAVRTSSGGWSGIDIDVLNVRFFFLLFCLPVAHA